MLPYLILRIQLNHEYSCNEMHFYFDALQTDLYMASQCLQLNFGEVLSAWRGVSYLCLKKKGGKRDTQIVFVLQRLRIVPNIGTPTNTSSKHRNSRARIYEWSPTLSPCHYKNYWHWGKRPPPPPSHLFVLTPSNQIVVNKTMFFIRFVY